LTGFGCNDHVDVMLQKDEALCLNISWLFESICNQRLGQGVIQIELSPVLNVSVLILHNNTPNNNIH
jgi:hypothetical protein